MSDIEKIAGTPIEITVKGKQLKFSPLTNRDFGKLKRLRQKKKVEAVMELLPAGQERAKVLSDLFNFDFDILDYMQTTEGILKVLELSLAHNHTKEQVDFDKVIEEMGLDEMITIYNQLLPIAKGKTPKKAEEKKS